MKTYSILTLAIIASTISLGLAVTSLPYSGVFYASVACAFLLLTVSGDYASTRNRYLRLRRSGVSAYPASTSTHRLPLAA